MRATKAPSSLGMHHMSRRHGFSSFSPNRRRTVSRDKPSCPVSWTIATSEQHQGPARTTLGRVGAGRCHQKRFLVARQLARGARARLFSERRFQVAGDEAALGPIHRRGADGEAQRDLRIARPRVGGQQYLRPPELAGSVLAAAQQGVELVALGLASPTRQRTFIGAPAD
jgi:hypothetical protein